MLITLHMFSLSVVCTLNTQLKLLPFKWYTVLRRMVNGNFILTPTVSTHASLNLYISGRGHLNIVLVHMATTCVTYTP